MTRVSVIFGSATTGLLKGRQRRGRHNTPTNSDSERLGSVRVISHLSEVSLFSFSGISKRMVFQTYGLQLGGLHEDDGNHKNDEKTKKTTQTAPNKGVEYCIAAAPPKKLCLCCFLRL